jgi:hypothetical protein
VSLGKQGEQCLTDIEKLWKMYKMERTLGHAHQKRSDEKWMRIDGDIPKVLEVVSSPVAVCMVCAWEMRYRVKLQCLTDMGKCSKLESS